jgi:hypothetical protein
MDCYSSAAALAALRESQDARILRVEVEVRLSDKPSMLKLAGQHIGITGEQGRHQLTNFTPGFA